MIYYFYFRKGKMEYGYIYVRNHYAYDSYNAVKNR